MYSHVNIALYNRNEEALLRQHSQRIQNLVERMFSAIDFTDMQQEREQTWSIPQISQIPEIPGVPEIPEIPEMLEEGRFMQVLHQSLHDVPVSGYQPAPVHVQKTATVEECTLSTDTECAICYDTIRANCVCMTLSCCKTADSIKAVHVKCLVNCLRLSEVCPFCKSSKITFE
jgi:hypothetical protein